MCATMRASVRACAYATSAPAHVPVRARSFDYIAILACAPFVRPQLVLRAKRPDERSLLALPFALGAEAFIVVLLVRGARARDCSQCVFACVCVCACMCVRMCARSRACWCVCRGTD